MPASIYKLSLHSDVLMARNENHFRSANQSSVNAASLLCNEMSNGIVRVSTSSVPLDISDYGVGSWMDYWK